jgi:Tol biopolymer transport system component
MRRIFLAAAGTAVSCQVWGAGAPASTVTGADIFRLAVRGDPQIRTDGCVTAYVRQTYEVMTDRARRSIGLIDVASGEQTPIADGPDSADSPRWSPDGNRLAHIAVDDDGHARLMVRWMRTQTASGIADFTEAPQSVTWVPDGRMLAFFMFAPGAKPGLGELPAKPAGAKWAAPPELITDLYYRTDLKGYTKPGNTHVYVVQADGGTPRQLTSGDFDERGSLTWTPDSHYVLVTCRSYA